MTTNHTPPPNRGWKWIAAAVIAALFSLIVWGSVSPAAAQSASTDLTSSFNPPYDNSSSTQSTRRVFLPVVFGPYRAPTPTPSAFGYGVQIYSDPNSDTAALPLAKQAQVAWVRHEVTWTSIEPTNTTPDHYQFNALDHSLATAQANGLHYILTIMGNPEWANKYAGVSNGPIAPEDVSEFAQFMGAMVERYDGDGSQDAPGSPVADYFELYNEPDAGYVSSAKAGASYWGPFGAEYAQMLCVVRRTMKAASPRAQIVMGGIASDWFKDEGGPFVRGFLDNVLAAGGGKCLDVMNFHYYPAFAATWDPYGPGLSGKANYFRSKLAQYGLGNIPMVVTEAGWHSNPYPQFPSTPEIQAGMVVKLFVQSLASNLRVMMWWTWSDKEIAGYWGDNGLLDVNLQPKLSYYAYQTVTSELGQAAFQRALSAAELGGANVQAYLFQRGGPLYVLWSNVDSSQRVSLPGSSARVKDYVGKVVATVADGDDGKTDGRVRITFGSRPVYVEIVS